MSDQTNGDMTRALLELTSAVTKLDTRTEGRFSNLCERLESVETEVRGIRTEQGAMGVRLAELTTTCAQRGKHCNDVHAETRHRLREKSDEMERVQLQQQRQASHLEMVDSVLGEVRETSKVTHIAELQRAATIAAWRRIGRGLWKHGWKVLVIVGGATGLAAVVKHLVSCN